MAYGGNKKISALRWRFIHQDGITIVDLTVGHFSILFTRLQAAKSVLFCFFRRQSYGLSCEVANKQRKSL